MRLKGLSLGVLAALVFFVLPAVMAWAAIFWVSRGGPGIAAFLLGVFVVAVIAWSVFQQWRYYRLFPIFLLLLGFATLLVWIEAPLREGSNPDVFLGLLPLTLDELPWPVGVGGPDDLREVLEDWTPEQWTRAFLSLALDTIFIPFYLLALQWGTGALPPVSGERWWRRLRLMPILAAGVDLVENGMLIVGFTRAVTGADASGFLWVAWWAALLKLIPFYGSLGFVLRHDNRHWEERKEKRKEHPQTDEGQLQKHMLGTYHSLRFGLWGIGLTFPLFLLAAGPLWYAIPWQTSMSAYYWAEHEPPPRPDQCPTSLVPPAPRPEPPLPGFLKATELPFVNHVFSHLSLDTQRPMRSWFVGTLFVLGASLYLYRGFSERENLWLNSAGTFAVGVALFPMPWACVGPAHAQPPGLLHFVSAASAFGCLMVVAATCGQDTLKVGGLDENRQTLYRAGYYLTAFGMLTFTVASLIAAYVSANPIQMAGAGQAEFSVPESWVFWLETANMWFFAAYWAIKSWEMNEVRASGQKLEQQAAEAQVQLTLANGVD